MRRVLCQHEDLFGPWMMKILNNDTAGWFPGRGSIIGLYDDVKGPIAGCLYEGHNGASIMLHCATDQTKRWMIREFLWFVFAYPFEQLRVNKIICPVNSTNVASKQFVNHLGFTLEATLQHAAPNGDMLIYTMTNEQCRWLKLRDRYRGNSIIQR